MLSGPFPARKSAYDCSRQITPFLREQGWSLSWNLFWKGTILKIVALQRKLDVSLVFSPQSLVRDQLLNQTSDPGISHCLARRKNHHSTFTLVLIPKEESLSTL